MKTYEEMDYDSTQEALVSVLAQDKQDEDRHFFRVLTSYYFAVVASMMRAKIHTQDRGEMPINFFAINMAPSGFGKGRSTSRIEREVINQFQHNFVNYTFPTLAMRNLPILATQRAAKKGLDPDRTLEAVEKEFEKLGPMAFCFDGGSAAAIRQVRHQLLMANSGALNMQVDEIGNKFSSLTESLTAFLELYDGGIKQKIIKNSADNSRNEEIVGVTPSNMLLFGTPTRLLNGGKTEDEFYEFLAVGFARRTFFGFQRSTRDEVKRTPKEVLQRRLTSQNDQFIQNLSDRLGMFADIAYADRVIDVPMPILELFTEYELSNAERALEYADHDELRISELKDRHAKAVRLAGAYAFIDGSPEVTENHAYAAIKLAEDSGQAFDQLLTRDKAHVKLAKYVASMKAPLTQADLIEDLPFYRGTVQQKQELMTLATAYGYQNNIIIKKFYEDGVEFFRGETLKETNLNEMIVSYAHNNLANGFQSDVAPFDKLHLLTQKQDYHWCSHYFEDGHRKEEKVIPGFNMLVLDIDDGTPLNVAKQLLADYKALYYTTTNHQKEKNGITCDRYRIIMPINYELKLDSKDFKEFMKNVFAWLPFETDEATAQRSRKWVSTPGHYEYTDGEILDVLPFIPKTSKNQKFKESQLDQAGLDNLERWMLNNVGDGNRNNMLLRYSMVLVDAGLDEIGIQTRVFELNEKMDEPLPESEILATVMKTVIKACSERDDDAQEAA